MERLWSRAVATRGNRSLRGEHAVTEKGRERNRPLGLGADCSCAWTDPCSPTTRATTHGTRLSAAPLAGIEHGSVDTCRHTFAAWSIRAGVQLFYLSRVMGASIEMIGHLVPDSEAYLRACSTNTTSP
jgi:hypothetical protein